MLRIRVFTLPLTALLSASVSHAAPAPTGLSNAPPLKFEHVSLDATGESPEICLHFNQQLDPHEAASLAGFIHVTPQSHPAPRAEGKMFCLAGLAFGRQYQVQIDPGFSSVNGNHLTSSVTLAARFGSRDAHIALTGDGFILPGRAAPGVAVESVNVETARIHVFRVSPHEQLPAPAGVESQDINLSQTTLNPWSFRHLLDTSMREIWRGTMSIDGAPNKTTTTSFPLSNVIERGKPGLYLVTVENASLPPEKSPVETALPPRRAANGNDMSDIERDQDIAAHWVNMSDLGMTMLRGEDGLTVAIRSLADGTPMAGVNLSLRARDGSVLGTITTDTQGLGHFDAPLLRGRMADHPSVLLATHGDDFGFLRLDRPWFDFSERHAEGADIPASPGDSRALVQLDRGIYRPGETLRALVLMRDRAGKALDDSHPILVLHRPDGMEERRVPLSGGQTGGYALSLPLNASAPSGLWRADILLDPTLPAIGSTHFNVQDFVPPVIAASFTPPAFATVGQAVTIDATVRFLYGAPGAGLKSDSSYSVTPAADPVPGYKSWSFGFENEDMKSAEGEIDAAPADPQGRARLSFTPDIPRGMTKPLEVDVRAGFLDPTGRRVGERLTIPVRRTTPLTGLHVAADNIGGSGSAAIPVDLASFDPDNRPLPLGKIHWTLSRINRIYNWSHSDDNGWTFSSHTVDVPMQAGDLATDARGKARIAPTLDWGEYRLSASTPSGETGSSLRFHVGWGLNSDANTPDRLPLTVRDARIAPDGSTVLHIGGGFAGQAQVTLATDRVLGTQSLDVPKEGLDVPVTAAPNWHSGVYALVTLYRPLKGPAASGLRPHDPVRAVGVAWIGVDQSAHQLAVALDPPKTVVPRRRITIPISVHGAHDAPADHVRVAVAAVDQGILSLTHFTPLDMFDAVFGRQRLGLDMVDNYGSLLLTDAKAGRIRSGGDGASKGADADGPPVRTTQSVALFDGPVTLDASGHGSVSFDLPDFDGQLHLMASAWSENALGNAQADITSRDPVFPDLGLPRFLAPGDTSQALVSIVNVDGPAARYVVQLSTDGPLQIPASSSTIEAEVKRGARADMRVPLIASPTMPGRTAIAHIHLTLRRAGQSAPLLTRSWPIGIRLAHIPVTVTQSAWLPPAAQQRIDAKVLTGFEPNDTQVTLGLSASGGLDTVALLQSLQSSLWGSSDDLAAQARALLQVNDPTLLGPEETKASLNRTVTSAIETLLDRQNPSGEIGQWGRSDGRSLPQSLDYIADFLVRAKAAGYAVPRDRLDLLLDHIETAQIQGSQEEEDDGNGDGGSSSLNTRAYATYVLARAGRLHPDVIHNLAAALVTRKDQGRTRVLWAGNAETNAQAQPLALGHIAVSLALDDAPDDGSPSSPGALFDAAIAALGPARVGPPPLWDGNYWAYVRDLGGLAALAAEAHDDRRTRLLIERFGKLTLAPDDLMNTTKTALLEAASAMNADTEGRSVRIQGRPNATPLRLPLTDRLTPAALEKGVTIENTGRKALFRTVTLHGEPDGNAQPVAHGLTLEMHAYTLTGAPFDLTRMKQNDRFIISLNGTALKPGRYQVAVTDLLPAGWEIERIVAPFEGRTDDNLRDDDENDKTQPPYAFLGELTRPDHTAAQDDRFTAVLNFSTENPTLAARGFRVAYIARAVTPGHFALPEAVVSGRRRPSLMARTASAVVEIAPH